MQADLEFALCDAIMHETKDRMLMIFLMAKNLM